MTFEQYDLFVGVNGRDVGSHAPGHVGLRRIVDTHIGKGNPVLVQLFGLARLGLRPIEDSAGLELRRPGEAAVVEELMKFHGVSLAVSSSALRQGKLPDTEIYRPVINNFNPKRSGEVFIVFEPNWFINDMEGLTVASTHGSPWRYDTYVPIVFAGMGLGARTVDRRVQTVDVAVTLSAFMGIKPPSGSAGVPLIEVLAE